MKYSAIFLSAAVVISLPIHAEDTQQLAPITIEAQRDNTQGTPLSLTPTATESHKNALQTAGAVSSINAERYRNGRSAGQDDALRLIPGVIVKSNNGADDTRLSIRGSGLSSRAFGRGINSYQDGIPLGRLDTGTTAQIVDVLAYEHIDVLRGANGLSLGSAALGGAINYHSYTGYTAPKFLGRLAFGPDQYQQAQVATGGFINDNVDYFVSLSGLQSDGFRDQQAIANTRFNGNVGVQLSETVETRTYIIASDANAELAGTIAKEDLATQRESANQRNIDVDADRNWQDIRLANKTRFQLSDEEQVDLELLLVRSSLDHLPTPFTGIINNDYQQYGIGARYQKQSQNNRLIAGIRIGRQDDQDRRFRYENNGRSKGEQAYSAEFIVDQYEVFVENTLDLSKQFQLTTGFQYIESQREFVDLFTDNTDPLAAAVGFQPRYLTGDQSYVANYRGFNPKIGARYTLNDDQYAFINIAQSIGTPSSSEANTRTQTVPFAAPPLNPVDEQRATTLELGTKGQTQTLLWDVTYYYSKIKDELSDDSVIVSPSPFAPPALVIANIDETKHQGIEAGLEWQAKDNVIVSMVYNWSDFTIIEDSINPANEGNTLPGVPEHTVYSEVALGITNELTLTPNFRFVDSYETTYDNTGGTAHEVDSYRLWGLRANYEHSSGVSAFIDARNLTDEVYAINASPAQTASGTSADVTPGQGRAYFVGIQYKL